MSTEDTPERAENHGALTGMRKPPRTTCKICWCSIFESEETKWVISPSPGIAHKDCPESPEQEE